MLPCPFTKARNILGAQSAATAFSTKPQARVMPIRHRGFIAFIPDNSLYPKFNKAPAIQ
jgi:hypothetical protein